VVIEGAGGYRGGWRSWGGLLVIGGPSGHKWPNGLQVWRKRDMHCV
jgi:hypothetical protein